MTLLSRRGATLLILAVLGSAYGPCCAQNNATKVPRPGIPWAPRQYQCVRGSGLTIDGALLEPAWQAAAWTEDFVDIEGQGKPAPRFRTRVKMLWDDWCFYVGAELQEPHLWATLQQRDTVIFHDHDFEVFIDPDGDTHLYYELEVNALGTAWDLLLVKPYRDGGPAVNGWDIRGLRVGVALKGTLNNPADVDSGWSVEIAMPWEALGECAAHKGPPVPGEYWRVNFSRVEWRTQVAGGSYVKVKDPATGRPLPEDNWVWSPQGVVNMHYPEMWGFVHFVADPDLPALLPVAAGEEAKWRLREVYYAQWQHHAAHGRFADKLPLLPLPDSQRRGLRLSVGPRNFLACCAGADGGTWWIAQDGRVWKD